MPKINALGYAKGAKVSMPLSALKDNTKYYIGVVAVDRLGSEVSAYLR